MEAVQFFFVFFLTEKESSNVNVLYVLTFLLLLLLLFYIFYFERLESVLFQGPQRKTRICLVVVVVVVDLLCSCIHSCNRKTVYNVQNQ